MAFTVKSAKYQPEDGTAAVDVTAKVKALAGKNGLFIDRVSNEGLGVGPVGPGVRKRLIVDYKLDGKAGQISALERKSLKIGSK